MSIEEFKSRARELSDAMWGSVDDESEGGDEE